MGFQQLVQYIIEQNKRGHTPGAIREFLIRNNYPQQIVDSAIQVAFNQQTNNSLISFVQEHMRQGFDADSIRRYLTAYGYPPYEIEQAISSSKAPSVKVHHHIDFSNKTFGVIIGVLIAVVFVSFIFFTGDGGEKALLDYNIKTLDKTVKQGSEIRYTHSFKNIGGKKDYDVFVEYFIQNIDTYEVVYRSQETIGIDTLETQDGSFPISQDWPEGNYILKAIVTYDDKEARAYDSFSIIKASDDIPEPTCEDNIKNQNEKGIDCGGPCSPCSEKPEATCTDGIKNQDEKGVDCGGPCEPCPSCRDGEKNQGESGIDCGGPCRPCSSNQEATCNDGIRNQGETDVDCGGPCESCSTEATCSDGVRNQNEAGVDCGGPCRPCQDYSTDLTDTEIISQVKTINTDYKKGIALCNQISSTKKKDDCFLALATGDLNMSNICDQITSKSKADICYVNFMKKNDFTVCDKIYESYLKRSCKSYQNMYRLSNEPETTEDEQETEGQNEEEPEKEPEQRWEDISNDTISVDDQDELLDIAKDISEQPTPVTCQDIECFNNHFSNCSLAKFTNSWNQSSTYYHEIRGRAAKNCEVFTKVNLHRNTGLIGKTMTCHMDNSTGFKRAFNETLFKLSKDEIVACEGDLSENYGNS